MAKFNQSTKGRNITTNKSGHKAYKMSDKEKLMTMVLTSMFGEKKFYGDNTDELIKLAEKTDPDFLMRLAVYARKEMNLRSVSHALCAVIAKHGKGIYTRKAIHGVVQRPDDILEIFACYNSLYGKPFPNAMKRQIAEEMKKFNEYQFAKYNGGDKEFTFKDVLRICHPTPDGKRQEILFGKILNDSMETPYTWETQLSARGNTREVWNELIDSGDVGYMALLRNLKNIINAGANYGKVLRTLSDPRMVKKSKQFPFRYLSAYKRLCKESISPAKLKAVRNALDDAIVSSVENMDKILGRTLIAVDVSGSMHDRVSAKSEVTCVEIGAMLGMLANEICEDATVVYFNSCDKWWGSYPEGYEVKHYGKYDSILEEVSNTKCSGGTDMSLPMQWALRHDTGRVPFDRVIYLSDNECNWQEDTVQTFADRYRRNVNKNFWVHAIDLQGYGTQQFAGSKFNLITGWSERVLEFINMAEAGLGSQVKKVEEYQV